MARTFICTNFLVLISFVSAQDYYQTPKIGSQKLASCYNNEGQPQRCIPEFENAAFMVQMEATNTCGDNGDTKFCIQTSAGISTRSCDVCHKDEFSSYYLTDLHHEQDNQTWWQSETMKEGIQYPNQVNLTLHLGKAYDITYVRIVFYSPRPQSFAVYKKTSEDLDWEPFQYFSASCRDTYGVTEQRAAEMGAETRALCTSEYSDISPLSGGNVLFSTLEGRPSGYTFDSSPELQEWVTATDLRISLDRLNTFSDEIFGDAQVLQSYWYAIADVAVGARCKCNGHASVCDTHDMQDGSRIRSCRCEHNTAGRDCERCLDFYNDAPWGRASPTNVHECKACNCNGFSNKCYFDKELYERTGHGGHCLDCAENRDGPNCERCKENYFQSAGDVCLPCDCNPTGIQEMNAVLKRLDSISGSLARVANELKACVEEVRLVSARQMDRLEQERASALLAASVDAQVDAEQASLHNMEDAEPKKCANCNREASAECSLCRRTPYCSTYCQKKDWASHQIECLRSVQTIHADTQQHQSIMFIVESQHQGSL